MLGSVVRVWARAATLRDPSNTLECCGKEKWRSGLLCGVTVIRQLSLDRIIGVLGV